VRHVGQAQRRPEVRDHQARRGAQAAVPVARLSPAAQPFPMGGTVNIPGMAGLPGMFMNMDLTKLRAMAMAARNGDKAEAA